MGGVRLFVYGTLKRGQRNHGLLRGQVFRGEAETLPRYRLYDAGTYPCLVEDAERGRMIGGEVWDVEDSARPAIDALEGAPDLFHLQPIALRDVPPPVYAYFYRRDVSGFAECGANWPGDAARSVGGWGKDAGARASPSVP
jgi:gamma-glutamylcyclotransferase (GGCT)/AIG2-like uncharacterized protein YtfP